MQRDHDVIVIGGGSAGYAAARTAAAAGADVAIVDHGPLGGLCILKGCMPSKAILRSAAVASLVRRAEDFGLLPARVKADLPAIMERKDRLRDGFAEYRIQQLRDPRFTLYEDCACFVSPRELQVGERVLRARAFIVATGSTIQRPTIAGLEEVGYLTSDDALQLQDQPDSLMVLGGGSIALELAQFYLRIGTRVTLIQRSPHVLSAGDEDLARPLEEALRAEGMVVFTGTQLVRFSLEHGSRTVHFTHQGEEKTASAELILQALGRRPNTDALGLDAAGVDLGAGGIAVSAEMRTGQPHIFAVGDVNGLHEVVHLAIQQGEIAAHNALHEDEPTQQLDDRLKMQVVFTDPAVASVGRSEKECQTEGLPYLAASLPFDDLGKAMCLGEIHGHVKLLCHPQSGELLGAHIVGPEAGELIHELGAVMHYRGTVRDLLQIPHYHPTLAEIITYPAEDLVEQLPATGPGGPVA